METLDSNLSRSFSKPWALWAKIGFALTALISGLGILLDVYSLIEFNQGPRVASSGLSRMGSGDLT